MLGFLLGLMIGALVVNYLRNKYTKEINDLKSLIELNESTLNDKSKYIASLKLQIQDMYKTIDEYTAEKSLNEIEVEISEKTIKRKRTK